MNLYIDNLSALFFLSMVETSLDEVSQPCAHTTIREAVGSLAGLKAFDLSRFDTGPAPLHVMVGRQEARTSARSLACHVRTTHLPAGALRRLDANVFIASPELCFFEMATRLPFAKLVEFGYLLCGTYTVNPDAPVKNGREPLTTKRRLASFAMRMADARGRAAALKAIGLVAEGSASPRETKAAALLSFPVRLGGYGFDLPTMNYRVDFPRRERELFGKTCVVLDLFWPEHRFGIEYDGQDNHTDPRDLSRDRRKSSELQYRGIEVLRLDKQQLANPFQVSVLARKAARAMGLRFRKPTAQQWTRKEELFNALMR